MDDDAAEVVMGILADRRAAQTTQPHRDCSSASPEHLCACGHTTHWHGGRYAETGVLTQGAGSCEDGDCDCPRFRPFGSPTARMLHEFHAHPNYQPEDATLRNVLHREEHQELQDELDARPVDRAKLARELADVVYVCYGTARVHGVDLDAALREVHRAAVSKLDANLRREDGKVLKFPGFHAPRMVEAIRQPGKSTPTTEEHPDAS